MAAGFRSLSKQLLVVRSRGTTSLVVSVFSRRFCGYTAEHVGLQSLYSQIMVMLAKLIFRELAMNQNAS